MVVQPCTENAKAKESRVEQPEDFERDQGGQYHYKGYCKGVPLAPVVVANVLKLQLADVVYQKNEVEDQLRSEDNDTSKKYVPVLLLIGNDRLENQRQ